ncbi:aldehyde dehydrogenase family protein [Pantoea ananatis]|uniref:aldehyde dehydrogenase family protein n=1 Tax=Pantoea ananas TaxID=553 RepID=UPI0039B8FCB9
MYPFSHDRARIETILHATIAGGVTVNDSLLHFAANALPFGGIGPSGMGAYHGRAGFDAFSKALPGAAFFSSQRGSAPTQRRDPRSARA